jgi:glutathione S-transferase
MGAILTESGPSALLESRDTEGTSMAYVDIVTVLALLQFIVFGARVGMARGKYGVKAPATTGNEVFERYFRVQQNTLEQLIVLVPALYLFSRYFFPPYAAAIGVVYLIGREIYAASYVKSPAARGLGHLLSFVPTVVLLFGALAGAILQFFGR